MGDKHLYLVSCIIGRRGWQPYGVFEDFQVLKDRLLDEPDRFTEEDTTVHKIAANEFADWEEGECMDDEIWGSMA